jgi:hypothetical protein
MRLDTFQTSRRHAILMGASLAIGAASPLAAQDDATPAADSVPVSETASQLPAADLPSMNPQGFIFEVESTYSGMFSEIPDEAPVYQMTVPEIDAERAAEIAAGLGLEGDVQEAGTGTFDIQAENGMLFITPGMMQFISSADVPDGDLPNDEEAVAFSREWLRQVGLLPSNVGDGKVQTRIENPPRIVVSLQPVRPAPLLSASPNITVTIGPEGAVLESTYQWADISQGEQYKLRGTEAAWVEVEGRRAYLETIIPGDAYQPGSVINGQAVYTSVYLAYTTSGLPGETQYLQPVYVFTGQLTPEGSEESYAITSYVPALINSQQPVG